MDTQEIISFHLANLTCFQEMLLQSLAEYISQHYVAVIATSVWKNVYGHAVAGTKSKEKDTRFYGPSFNGAADIIRALGPDHSRFRRNFSHAFSEKALREQQPLICHYVDMLIDKLLTLAREDPQKPVEIVHLYNLTTFDIMGDLTFGDSLDLLAGTGEVVMIAGSPQYSSASKPMPLIPQALKDKAVAHYTACEERVDKRIDTARNVHRPDIWGIVMGQKEELRLSHAEMYANSKIFMVAGTETTTTVSSPDESGEEAQGPLVRMTYWNACIEERLRIYPPVPVGLPRVAPDKGLLVFVGSIFPASGKIAGIKDAVPKVTNASVLAHLGERYVVYNLTDGACVVNSAQRIAARETPGVTPMESAAQIRLRPAIEDIVWGKGHLAVATLLAGAVLNLVMMENAVMQALTSTSTYTRTYMSTSTSTSTSTKTFTKTSTSKLPSATCNPKGTSNKARDVYDNGNYASINGECLPVMDFVSVDGLTEQLIESMCGGTIDPKYNEATQCDEFPFGSTLEGGDADAHTMCIVWWQNSIQSSLIRQYNRFYNLQTNDRFVVRILPGCDTVGSSSTSKRSTVSGLEQSGQIRSQKDGNNTLISSSYNIWRQDPIPGAPNGTGNIFVPLGAVAPGVFDTNLHITGTLNQLQILGDDGTEYSDISATAASASLNFTVPNSDNLFLVAPALQNASVNISYTCTVKPLPANSSTASAASSHIQDSMRSYRWWLLLLVVVEVLMVLDLRGEP
ncbi:hypothetical protein CNMCM5793_006645 [Aspergillus hiratsukae]|uniref:Deoxyribonuclease NucA/NucB domain-containing protein n=1 Tax=Aspergillus hiratsukae TaxID=1194566 RepID=A0A8H6PI23_9EURO|nr:hypothetical protein CNMCM5793_006645 [Aspergillus hiratsukae]KAF7173427.1 hypothetical protein CNMCM6106_007499 [Aspergillus hiratsukae]